METLPDLPAPDFDAVLDDLRTLSRNHLLVFRVEVGRTLAEAFYGGEVARYRARTETALKTFLVERAADLADIGLHPQLIRQSLLAWQVVSELPDELRPRLVYSHVVELARVEDAATRRLLAQATLDNGWTGDTLKDAVAAVLRGEWIDADPEPGLLPAKRNPDPDPAPDAKPKVGWALRRAERSAASLSAVADEWDRIDVQALSTTQRERALEAARQLRDRAERLEARLRREG
jgi:hypothetical protein